MMFADLSEGLRMSMFCPNDPSLVDTILAEGPIGMSGVARLVGSHRAGRPTHPSTPTRWCTRGVRLPDGRRVRLEAVRLNGRLVTSKPALVRFVTAQQEVTDGAEGLPVSAPTARDRAADRAADELRKLGG